MLFVRVTRSNAVDGVYQCTVIAGPYEDSVDAQYIAKQLRTTDHNRDSVYEVVDCSWVVTLTRKPGDAPEVISWHETEDDCKANAAAMQRGDYTVVIEPRHWPLE